MIETRIKKITPQGEGPATVAVEIFDSDAPTMVFKTVGIDATDETSFKAALDKHVAAESTRQTKINEATAIATAAMATIKTELVAKATKGL